MESTPEELGPLDVILLASALEPFCPVAENGGQYHAGLCLPACHVCDDLLLKRGEK